ncbi:hypothetical protein ACRRTK_002018 [Alexandromys fortis]
MMCDINIHKELYANTALICGTTMYSGTTNRMQGITTLIPSMTKIEIIVLRGYKYSVWIITSIPEDVKVLENQKLHTMIKVTIGLNEGKKGMRRIFREGIADTDREI